jgi:superfamily II DNA or RNA helicase
MSTQTLQPGQRVSHTGFGEGVVIAPATEGYLRVFFPSGERRVHHDALLPAPSKTERIIANVEGSSDRLRQAWLHYEAFSLPLIENAAALTAARIDLLPHQVVLTHRIATAFPRRFLVADEVGLGKTIETALVLRELASRGELNRALMVVPAGLVNNWHRELNEVFNRDLVVFDEAHHLSAYRSGNKVRRTENYKLADALRGHSRDLILLSATPHQGDHFRFWMLIQLLNPTLFASSDEMLDERHRLNAVVYRRTKADACTSDGSPLFSRRWVHTESFTMSVEELAFYGRLREYLRDGFALAKKQGSKGRALGFVMTIFQKIAASSFAAVRSTLRRRLLMLTIHEAILRDQALDIDGHSSLMEEARKLVHEETQLAQDAVGKSEADRILADCKLRLVKKLDEDRLAMAAASETSEIFGTEGEEMASMAVELALPEERLRIVDLLAAFPKSRETKIDKLLRALGALWNQDSKEKVVIFATYLATVDLLKKEIESMYPGQGVVVLRGGDHGAKVAAENKFKRTDGPKVLVCTAAGREGINLQFARVLFNFDLPWNPMDVEQRIGRIHRYGQRDTAQVYNLILSDTIEGWIFLLLNEKLLEIARTLGKVDEHGNVTEDLRSQILGQLSERLSYDQLYRDALSDPELKRTRQELEAAMANADEARKVVFELFQDLDRFSFDDYKPFSNIEVSQMRLKHFLSIALEQQGGATHALEGGRFTIATGDGELERIGTMDREIAKADDSVDLIGLDHPLVADLLNRWRTLSPENIGTAVSFGPEKPCALSIWLVREHVGETEQRTNLVPLAVDGMGRRMPVIEKKYTEILHCPPASPVFSIEERRQLLISVIEPMLQRELQHRGIASETGGHSVELVGWVEVS